MRTRGLGGDSPKDIIGFSLFPELLLAHRKICFSPKFAKQINHCQKNMHSRTCGNKMQPLTCLNEVNDTITPFSHISWGRISMPSFTPSSHSLEGFVTAHLRRKGSSSLFSSAPSFEQTLKVSLPAHRPNCWGLEPWRKCIYHQTGP